MDLNSRINVRVVANVTDRQKTGSLYCAMPEAGATKILLSYLHLMDH